jgi:hypothetical protein
MQNDTFVFTNTLEGNSVQVVAIDGFTAWEKIKKMHVYKSGIVGINNYWSMVILCRHCQNPVHDSGVYCSGLCFGMAKLDLET